MSVAADDRKNQRGSQATGVRSHTLLFCKGLAMGLGDSVPGVSGGTVAFITGIYPRLLHSLRSFDLEFLRMLFRAETRLAWRHVDGNFLAVFI